MTGVEQVVKSRLVRGLAAALVDDGAVPFEAVSIQRGKNAFRGARLLPGRVDVLDAQQPVAAVSARLQVAGSRSEQ